MARVDPRFVRQPVEDFGLHIRDQATEPHRVVVRVADSAREQAVGREEVCLAGPGAFARYLRECRLR